MRSKEIAQDYRLCVKHSPRTTQSLSCICCSGHPSFTQDTPAWLLLPGAPRPSIGVVLSDEAELRGSKFRVVVRGIASSRPCPTDPRPEKLNSHGVVATERQRF